MQTVENSRVGVVITAPGAANPVNDPHGNANIGLVVTCDSSLDLSLVEGGNPVGIIGFSNNGSGVAGYSTNGGYGVYGNSKTSVGVKGETNYSPALYGQSNSGPGAVGYSVSGNGIEAITNTGVGVYASSYNDAPLHLDPSAQVPAAGTRRRGDIYVDNSGTMHIFDGVVWKKFVQSPEFERFGAVIMPPGSSVPTGNPAAPIKIGLIASSDNSLNMAQLEGNDPIGIYGSSIAGYGVWGYSESRAGIYGQTKFSTGVVGDGGTGGIGVSGNSSGSTGVQGNSTSGQGVWGYSERGTGVYGQSRDGRGVVAQSDNSAPFRIEPRSTAPVGPNQAGDMYVDNNGNLFFYTGAAWKQVVLQ